MRLIDHQFIVIGGKGGVGRTTVAALIALWAEREGKRVLICQTRSRAQLSGWLGVPVIDEKIREIRPGLAAVNMTPQSALREYGAMVLHSKFLSRQVLENRVARRFLQAVPGLDYYAMLGKAWYHSTEIEAGRPKWDLVILDGPATGHLLSMLDVPVGIVSFVVDGPLVRPAEQMIDLLADKNRSRLVLVATPEELPVTEAMELYEKQSKLVKMKVGAVVVNGMEPAWFSSSTLKLLAEVNRKDLVPPLALLIESARQTSLRRASQERQKLRLESALGRGAAMIEKQTGGASWTPEMLQQVSLLLAGALAEPDGG